MVSKYPRDMAGSSWGVLRLPGVLALAGNAAAQKAVTGQADSVKISFLYIPGDRYIGIMYHRHAVVMGSVLGLMATAKVELERLMWRAFVSIEIFPRPLPNRT